MRTTTHLVQIKTAYRFWLQHYRETFFFFLHQREQMKSPFWKCLSQYNLPSIILIDITQLVWQIWRKTIKNNLFWALELWTWGFLYFLNGLYIWWFYWEFVSLGRINFHKSSNSTEKLRNCSNISFPVNNSSLLDSFELQVRDHFIEVLWKLSYLYLFPYPQH